MVCPKCGAKVAAESTSCPICFASLTESPSTQAAAPVPAQPITHPAAAHPALAPGGLGQAAPGAGMNVPAGLAMPKVGVPREEEYMPQVGIPGIDNRQPVSATPDYMRGASGLAGAGGGTGGEMRVSLTGEVLEVAPPSPKVINPKPIGSGQRPAPGGRPAPGRTPPPAAARNNVRARSNYGSEEDGSSKGASGLVYLLILVLGFGSFGGWYWWNNRTNPKDQALKVYTAAKGQDWKTIYNLTAMSDAMKKKYPDADSYAKEVEQQLGANPVVKQMASTILAGLTDIAVGEPTINGDKADVPTSAKMTVAGQSMTLKGTAHMIKVGGAWKLNATDADDPAAAQKLSQDFIGRPEGAGGMGMGAMGGRGR